MRDLEGLMKKQDAQWFNEQVDRRAFPEYYNIIACPICLSTIRDRVKNGFYRRKEAILSDLDLLYNNASKFNKPNSPIVEAAQAIVTLAANIVNGKRRELSTKVNGDTDGNYPFTISIFFFFDYFAE